MSQTLYVGGLSYAVTDQELGDFFTGAGTVVKANVITDRETGRSRGFGFVEMSSEEEAQKAVTMFHGQEFNGRSITVDLARPREERPRQNNNRFDNRRSF